MYKFFLIVFLVAFAAVAQAQTPNPKFKQALADSLGADEYGMKMYTLVILKTGTNQTTDKAVLDSLFSGHMMNMGRMESMGKLIVAGPLSKNALNYRGIFILNTKTVEETRALLDTDPAIKAKVFDVEIFPWYGSAALPLYMKHHDEVKKKDF
ncbi:YciI family protein [Emticicia agri]|uniref:YCII-related domain-containing protein n=1 Tax=Emticicia agri TaxID=2492393 RepID=A0A4Q5LTR2_9BACT|nr:hypothetical protein [Emticicia agri]RYU93021.1 hypothetical protein EWM59_24210 [Emticicia agri]